MDENQIGEAIIGCALRVHKALGPGLLESAYETCLVYELHKIGLSYRRQVLLPYDGQKIDAGYRMDVRVEARVISLGRPAYP